MKFFADMHLCPPLEKADKTKEMIEKSAELGYDAVGITFPAGASLNEVQNVKDVCISIGVDLVTRTDLTPKNPASMLWDLRNLRRRFEIVAVRCFSKAVARQAAKDRRVDLISFPSTDVKRRFYDVAEAELTSKALAGLEIDIASLLCLQGLQRSRLLSFLRREALMAGKFSVPLILSSGANNVRFLRKPEDYMSLAYLFVSDPYVRKQAFSENPQNIIKRNRRKLSSNYVSQGVYVIRRGKDCPGA